MSAVAVDPQSALNVPNGVTLRHHCAASPVGTIPRGTRGTLVSFAATTGLVDWGDPYGCCTITLNLLDHSPADVTHAAGHDSVRRAEQALDAAIEQLIATCTCDACERYRKAFARRAGYYAARIEEALRANHARSTRGGASTRRTP